uniref:non-specific serine/threonine protein kinase n=1 Tax=Oryza brachyantha TaxID=4533 RepID=J3MUE2_ORYBR
MAARFLVLLFLATLVPSSSTSTSLATNATAAGGDNATTFSFSSFPVDVRGVNVTVVGDADVNGDALQITPDTLNDASRYLTNKSGRVLYATPFRLWRREGGGAANGAGGKKVASFSTVFTINVFRPNGTVPGEGFAFIIAPSAAAPPAGSAGGFLGLTNAATDGNAANQIVAVELDTEKQPYDPDDNHIGLDVNGVVSVANASLAPLGIEISPVKPVKYDVWIDYDGAARRMKAYMAVTGKPKPASPVLDAPLDLGATVAERSYFGFSASTGFRYQLNCVLAWNMTVEKLPSDGDHGKSLTLALTIGVPGGGGAPPPAAAALGYWLCVVKRRKVHGDDPSAITGTMIRSLAGGPREFDYRELRKATNNFDERMKLGQGGYGVVYRGAVVGDHTSPGGAGSTVEVAVKKFSRASTQGQNDFLAELSIINRLRHKHLVRLVGWSHDNGELLLVYEYMPNGSLDQHLFGAAPGRRLLEWDLRYSIVAGVASALHYLHDEYDQKVVHRDLKASNVMLDAAFSARLGDFGLARAIETDKTSYMEEAGGGVHGTVGYIAPECFHTEKATRNSDVGAATRGKEPRWLRPLLSARYFAQCGDHGDSAGGGRCECNMFCVDCAGDGGALCAYCLPLHGGHRVVQVRRSSYHDVVRVSEVCRLIDVSRVQTYVINGAKIVFLNRRPQPARPPGKSAGAGAGGTAASCCEGCGRVLLDSSRFCSLACKLGGMKRDPELTFLLHGKLGLESPETATATAADEWSAPSKVRRTSALRPRRVQAAQERATASPAVLACPVSHSPPAPTGWRERFATAKESALSQVVPHLGYVARSTSSWRGVNWARASDALCAHGDDSQQPW